MRILEACFSSSLGGLELYCLDVARHLRRRGHDVTLWLTRGSKMAQHPLAAEVPTRLFANPGRVNPLFAWQAGRLIREQRFEVLHLHRSLDLGTFAPVRRLARLLTLHIEPALSKRDLYHRWAYRRLNRVLAISQAMMLQARENMPVKPEAVSVLYHGIDVDDLVSRRGDPQAFRAALKLPADAFLAGMIGRLDPQKGQETLLKACARISQHFPRLHVMIAGEPTQGTRGYGRYLADLANQLGIAGHTHFVGFQVDTAPVYAGLDLFVLASHGESFGLVVLEAMAQSLPVIATNAGGVPEIITDGSNGLLVPPQDEAALARALDRMIRDEELRRRLAQAGFRTVCDRFSLARHLDGLEEHFNRIIGAP